MTSEELVIYRLRNTRIIDNVDRSSIHVTNVKSADHPDYCDAYCDEAHFNNGDKLIEEDLDWLMNDHSDLLYSVIFEQQYL